MIRTLLETGSRVAAFCKLKAQNIDFDAREVRMTDKGNKTRDIPILKSLANELRLHLGERSTGYVFPSPRAIALVLRRIRRSTGAGRRSVRPAGCLLEPGDERRGRLQHGPHGERSGRAAG